MKSKGVDRRGFLYAVRERFPFGSKAAEARGTVSELEEKAETRRWKNGGELGTRDARRLQEARGALRRTALKQMGGAVGLVLVATAGGLSLVLSDDATPEAGGHVPVSDDGTVERSLDFERKIIALENTFARTYNQTIIPFLGDGQYSKGYVAGLAVPALVLERNRDNADRFEMGKKIKPPAQATSYEDIEAFLYAFTYGELAGAMAEEYGGRFDLPKKILYLQESLSPDKLVDVITFGHELRHGFDWGEKLKRSTEKPEGESFIDQYLELIGRNKGKGFSMFDMELAACAMEVEMLNAISGGELRERVVKGDKISWQDVAKMLDDEEALKELNDYVGYEVNPSNFFDVFVKLAQERKLHNFRAMKIFILHLLAEEYLVDGNFEAKYPLSFAKLVAKVYGSGDRGLIYENKNGDLAVLNGENEVTEEALANMRDDSFQVRR